MSEQPLRIQHWQTLPSIFEPLGSLGFQRLTPGSWDEPDFTDTNPNRRSGVVASFNQNVNLNIGEYIEVNFDWRGGGSPNANFQIRLGFFNGALAIQDGQDTLESARYWRVIIDEINTQPAYMSQFVLLDTNSNNVTPTNMSDNITPSPFVASTNSSGSAYVVFDGSNSTGIFLDEGEWVSIDLGTEETPSLGLLEWSSQAEARPLKFRVQHSNDNVNWETSFEYDDVAGICTQSFSFGLDNLCRDWVGIGVALPTRVNASSGVGANYFYQGEGGAELMQYSGPASSNPFRINGESGTTGNVVGGVNTDTNSYQLTNLTLRFTRIGQEAYALDCITPNNPVASATFNTGNVSSGNGRFIAQRRTDGNHWFDTLWFNSPVGPINGFAALAPRNFSIDNFTIEKKSVFPLNINVGAGPSSVIFSTNSPAHTEGAISSNNNLWHGSLTGQNGQFNNNNSFALMGRTCLRRGHSRTNGNFINNFVLWSQTSNTGNRQTSAVGTGVFENNELTQTFYNYSRNGSYNARPVGAVYQGLPPGTYDIYVVAHNNNSITDTTGDGLPDILSAGLQDNRIVVGIGITQDSPLSLPEYTPDNPPLTWKDLELVPSTSAWIEDDNYVKVRVTVNSHMDDYLYICVHYSHELSADYRVAGLTFVQIVKVS